MHSFDPVTTPLEGPTLVEASAGTGKTYAIASLYLRLVMEREEMTPPEILVVTFTEAATAELKERIRKRLRDARDTLVRSLPADDFMERMMESPTWPGDATARRRVERALSLFDLASIFTIHGFCARALADYPFECGVPFEQRIETDQDSILAEIVDDFRRKLLLTPDSPYIPCLQQLKRHDLIRLIKRCSTPLLTIHSPITHDQIDPLRNRCRETFVKLREIWETRGGELSAFFLSDARIKRNIYTSGSVSSLLDGLEALFSGDSPFRPVWKGELAGKRKLSASLKKDAAIPDDPFFTLWDRYRDDLELIPLTLRLQLLSFAEERLLRIRRRRGIRFFDDLLRDLHESLQREGGGAAAATLRQKYRAVLIDEFQDTDTLQCRIFERAFDDGRTPFFFIGDPKQSIYAFRGADIHAYLAQRKKIPPERHATLTVNRRSTPRLLDAFNRIFGLNGDRPFLFEDLAYHPVTPPDPDPDSPPDSISLEGFDPSPFQLWYLTPREGDSTPPTVEQGRMRIADTVVREIVRLLEAGRSGGATITIRGETIPLTASHIAVIVRSNSQGKLIQERLATFGVPSVRKSDEPVPASTGARDLLAVMEGIASPLSSSAVRRALATPLMGWDAPRIASTLSPGGEGEWETVLVLFRELHDLWREQGFIAAFRRLLHRQESLPRILSFAGGERLVTDILHCAELIHGEERRTGRGMESLISWFGDRTADPGSGDGLNLRLESDDDRVRIVTAHGSKGLEFPVVFTPFLWGRTDREEKLPVVVHEEGRLVADMGTDSHGSRRIRARDESLAEEIRLAYVAMTRARFRLYVAWGCFRGRESSPLAWILHRPAGDHPAVGFCDHLEQTVTDTPESRIRERLDLIAAHPSITLTVDPPATPERYVPPATSPPTLFRGTLSRPIDDGWRASSFTSLSRTDREPSATIDEPVHGHDDPPPASVHPFATLPPGPRTGTILHRILQRIDFSDPDPDRRRNIVQGELAATGEGTMTDTICGMLEELCAVELLEGFSLSRLTPGSWRTEMEFRFPIPPIASETLTGILDGHGHPFDPRSLARLDFRTGGGMMTGSIDMVFTHGGKYYLVDWKTNRLGWTPDDYRIDAVTREMERNLYPLQYLIYLTALHRHLRVRLPGYDYDAHMGGVFYLFLRGIDRRRTDSGIFRDRPARGVVERLDRELFGGGTT